MMIKSLVSRPSRSIQLRIEQLESRDLLSYSIIDLGTLGGKYTTPTDINDRGQVVGDSQTKTTTHAFLWDPVSGIQDLGALGTSISSAKGINERGQVVGWTSSAGTSGVGFVWTRGAGMTALPALPGNVGSRASAINENGQIVGWSTGDGFGHYEATLWDGADVVGLGTIGTKPARPADINDSGVIIGQIGFAIAGPSVIWENGAIKQIGNLGPFGNAAAEINNHGQITGTSHVTGPGGFFALAHPFLYNPGQPIQDLGTLACPGGMVDYGVGHGINDAGQVVGFVGCVTNPPTSSYSEAAVWNPGVGWQRLNELIPPGSGWDLTSATAINNKGQIVGVGLSASHHNLLRGFLLTPDPPPIPPPPFAFSNDSEDVGVVQSGLTTQSKIVQRTLGESVADSTTLKGLDNTPFVQPLRGKWTKAVHDPGYAARPWAVVCNPFGISEDAMSAVDTPA